MTARRTAGVVGLLSVAIGVAPFLGWFRVDVPRRRVWVSGVDATAVLWAVPLLAGVALICALVLAVGRPDPDDPAGRVLGWVIVVLGAALVAWCALAIVSTDAAARPDVPDPPLTPLASTPVAWITVGLAAIVTCIGLAWLRRGLTQAAGEARSR
jgi:hypothetical protein